MTQGCYLLFGELIDEKESTLGARSYKGSFNSWWDINDYINKDYKCFAWLQIVDSCTMDIVEEQLNDMAMQWNEKNKLGKLMYKIIGTHMLDGKYEVKIQNEENDWISIYKTNYLHDAETYIKQVLTVFPTADIIYMEETITTKEIGGFEYD